MDDDSNVLLKATRQSGSSPGQPALADRAGGDSRFSRFALASFVFATLSLAGFVSGTVVPFAPFVFLFFIPAIICGHLARREFSRAPDVYRNTSMATYGLAVGYLGLFLSIFVVSAMIFGLA